MMKPSTFGFLVVRGVRNLGKHWAMTIACIASLSVYDRLVLVDPFDSGT